MDLGPCKIPLNFENNSENCLDTEIQIFPSCIIKSFCFRKEREGLDINFICLGRGMHSLSACICVVMVLDST